MIGKSGVFRAGLHAMLVFVRKGGAMARRDSELLVCVDCFSIFASAIDRLHLVEIFVPSCEAEDLCCFWEYHDAFSW